jgi:hypothetical protein
MKKYQSELCFSAMAGVFPGADSIDALWQRIVSADVSPLTALPERWQIDRDAIYSPLTKQINKIYLDQGYCLPLGRELGNAAVWGRQTQITERVLKALMQEACPQGQDGDAFDGQATALVMGTSWSDESYFMAGGRHHQSERWFDLTDYEVLAQSLGIKGPVIAIDTACSSFAYAIDTAQHLIRTGQAQRVIVAGVNAFLPSALFLGFSQLGALSASGRIMSFGNDANGIVPGECVAAFLLEPLADALAADRQPLALLRGLGISSDGAEGSIFSPGKHAQINAYQRAYQELDPMHIDYIEAHGTGTPVGDTTELESLEAFFKPYRGAIEQRLPIGSLKSIIGHTLAASGAASLAKALLMLRHRMIPPHVTVQPHPLLSASCLELPTQTTHFPARDTPLRIGISSFGFGGANAHVIVEEALLAQDQPYMLAETPSVQRLDLAITHFDATFAVAPSNVAWQQGVLTTQFDAEQFFPPRFEEENTVVFGAQKPLQGYFFKEAMNIDIANFRMGPKQLAYVDPFKLLVTYRCKTMLAQQHPAEFADTALVMCANMGGEHFFDLYQKVDHYFSGNDQDAPDIIVDDVGTMLPTMVSGYPTRVLDLQGFHQTFSGGSGIFWHALRNAPAWLQGSCRTLVLGAGHYLNCAADAARAATASIAQGEGIGLLVLKPYQEAFTDHDAILAHLTCVVDRGIAHTLEQACALANVSLVGLTTQVCELQPDASSPLQGAQHYTGYLAEATGIEALAAAVYGADLQIVIEVRRQGEPQCWIFLEKDKLVSAVDDPAIKLPMEIRFSQAIEDQIPTALSVKPLLELATTLTASESYSPDSYPEGWIVHAHDALFDSLQTSLQLRMQLLEKIRQSSTGDAVPRSQSVEHCYASLHRLIDKPEHTTDGMNALLQVNETHPYFFDHALDHVPGILLLGGILQLVDLYKAEQCAGATFVSSIDIQFKRYADKALPIHIILTALSTTEYEVQVIQNNQLLCLCDVGVAAMGRRLTAHGVTVQPCQQPHFLHKARSENILVSDLVTQGTALSVKTSAVPADHYFAQGDHSFLSILYFLEIARQCFMLVAHQTLDIPVGMPMNLLQLRFALNTPIPRHSSLELIPHHQLEPWSGLMQTGLVQIALNHGQTSIGHAEITSQVINKEIYALQRQHTAHAEKT